MKTLFLTSILCLFLANQCAKKVTTQQSQEAVQSSELPPMKNIEELPEVGYEEFEGNRILEGELYTSKGAILGIGGVFISEDYQANSNNELLPELRPLIGADIEVKGDVYVYYCGRYEQCLTEGYMKWLRNIEYVKIIE